MLSIAMFWPTALCARLSARPKYLTIQYIYVHCINIYGQNKLYLKLYFKILCSKSCNYVFAVFTHFADPQMFLSLVMKINFSFFNNSKRLAHIVEEVVVYVVIEIFKCYFFRQNRSNIMLIILKEKNKKVITLFSSIINGLVWLHLEIMISPEVDPGFNLRISSH